MEKVYSMVYNPGSAQDACFSVFFDHYLFKTDGSA